MNTMEKSTPAPSRQAICCILAEQQATLCSTLHAQSSDKGDGYPFGSTTPYDVLEDGRLIIAISTISQHYRNLEHDARGSLFIAEQRGHFDPQAHARACVIGDFKEVAEEELERIRSSYLTRFPHSAARTLAHDFLYFQCIPKRIRWIGGFGSIHWISAENYYKEDFDKVAYQSRGIIEHMNEDHRDAMAELLLHFLDVPCSAEACTLLAANNEGLLIEAKNEEKTQEFFLPFPSLASDANSVRVQLIEMLKLARSS